jgi:hypothetical protein
MEQRGLIHLTTRPGYPFVVTLLDVPDLADVPGCLPGEQVGGEGCLPEEGEDVSPGNIPCLPGEHEPDPRNQKGEPSPKPPECAHACEEENNPEPASAQETVITTGASTTGVRETPPAPRTVAQAHGAARFPWEPPDRPDEALATLDPATRAALALQAREALLAEGVRVDHLITPVIEARMVDLWEAQTQDGGVPRDPAHAA